MNFEKMWEKALRNTEIVRSRIQSLKIHVATQVPYVLLSESTINEGDTIVRKGQVVVEKPSLIMPPYQPLLNGFELEGESNFNKDMLINFLLVRGVSLPSLKYDNITNSLDIHEGKLSAAIKHYQEDLQRRENVTTGLIVGPEDCWQYSLLIFICSQISRNAENDIKKLLEEFHRKDGR